MRLSLNISPCPNDTFSFDAIVNGRIDCDGFDFDVSYMDIEELNATALKGCADISKISYALLPEIDDNYALLDSGSALGRGNGPLLVKRKGFDAELRHVAIPGLHTTANALLRYLYPEITDKTPVLFSEIGGAVERGQFDAGVLIHEGRFVYDRLGLELVADLGEQWESRTSLPLPLGAIVMRRQLSEDIITRFDALLRRSIEYAMANPCVSLQYVKAHAQEMDDHVIDAHINLFVNKYSLSLGDIGRRAVERLAYGR